ncbi:hypothetical protein MTO96_034873 [Rhipicephalus appendiculatus]
MSVGPKTLPLGPSMLAPMEGHPPGSPSKMATDDLLNNLFVPLEQIQPGSQAPVNLHEENGVRAVIHIARNRPQEHVSVLVVSITSQSSLPVRRIAFQAAVPKMMQIKLQPPSATELPPHNPILPAAAITQVMLIANPAKDNVRLKYKLSYAIEEENHTHSGEVDCPCGHSRCCHLMMTTAIRQEDPRTPPPPPPPPHRRHRNRRLTVLLL